jgi:hypothetical protein
MRSVIGALALFFGLIPAWSQSPPTVRIPPNSPPTLAPLNQSISVRGTIVAYDWSTRYYMEGARVENFIFKEERGAGNEKFVRVVLLWHPTDKPRILPRNFYSPHQAWKLTLDAATPFDFVRQYCITPDGPTFSTDIGNGERVKLQRYVSPAVLPPDFDLPTNFRTAIANRPTSPKIPDPRSLQCLYLREVTVADP